jgi:hypothetical protein
LQRANAKIIVGIGIAIASVAAILILAMSAQSRPSASQPVPATEGQSINSLAGPDAYLLSGTGRSAIVVNATPKYVNLTRGESTTVTLNVSHRVGNNGFPVLQIIPSGVSGDFGLPSSNATMTSEERTELIKQGKPVPGLIPLSSFVKYSTPEFELKAGETKSIQMTITLPKDLPDEAVGKGIQFDPKLIISEMQNVSPDRSSDAIVFSTIVTVSVVG